MRVGLAGGAESTAEPSAILSGVGVTGLHGPLLLVSSIASGLDF